MHATAIKSIRGLAIVQARASSPDIEAMARRLYVQIPSARRAIKRMGLPCYPTRAKRNTEDFKASVVAKYRAGMRLADIAGSFGTTKGVVAGVLNRAGEFDD